MEAEPPGYAFPGGAWERDAWHDSFPILSDRQSQFQMRDRPTSNLQGFARLLSSARNDSLRQLSDNIIQLFTRAINVPADQLASAPIFGVRP